jgi:hypothetical protein
MSKVVYILLIAIVIANILYFSPWGNAKHSSWTIVKPSDEQIYNYFRNEHGLWIGKRWELPKEPMYEEGAAFMSPYRVPKAIVFVVSAQLTN